MLNSSYDYNSTYNFYLLFYLIKHDEHAKAKNELNKRWIPAAFKSCVQMYSIKQLYLSSRVLTRRVQSQMLRSPWLLLQKRSHSRRKKHKDYTNIKYIITIVDKICNFMLVYAYYNHAGKKFLNSTPEL